MIRVIPTFILKWLVNRNFRAREAGKLPDKVYWGDVALFRRIGPYTWDNGNFAKL